MIRMRADHLAGKGCWAGSVDGLRDGLAAMRTRFKTPRNRSPTDSNTKRKALSLEKNDPQTTAAKCSFCGKGAAEGRKLIAPPASPDTFICVYCLRAANLHLEQSKGPGPDSGTGEDTKPTVH